MAERPIAAALVTPSLYFGGAERWMITLAEETRQRIDWRGCAVFSKIYQVDNMVEEMGRLMPVWGYGPKSVARAAGGADVLVTWGITRLEEATAEWRRQRRGPIVFVGHGSGEFDRNAMKASGRIATHWAVVSRACVPAISETLPGVEVKVIENGIDPVRCRSTRSREEVRRELGIAPHEFLVGYVGRMVPEKNPLGVARGLACLPDRYRGIWIGDGYDVERQSEEIRKAYPGAILHPRVDTGIGDYLRALDCFVLVSPAEGFSLGFLEACYCGVPVIVTPVGVMPQLERRHGRHWGTVPVEHTPEQLAAEIVRLARQSPARRAETAAAARRIVADNYLARHMGDRWYRFLRRIVAEWPPPADSQTLETRTIHAA